VPDPYRATRDIDVLVSGPADENAIRALVEDISAVECPEDGLRFDLSEMTVETIRGEAEYAGLRARFHAFLGKAQIRVQIDFGVGDALVSKPEEIEYPTILPALPAPRLRGYRREASVAEKVEAMVTLDIRNSRMKDFHDVWALSSLFPFDGRSLSRSIEACFDRRGTSWTAETPRCLTSAFYQEAGMTARWRNYREAGAVLVSPPAEFERLGERIISFVGPVRDSLVARELFDSMWPAGGPWSTAPVSRGTAS